MPVQKSIYIVISLAVGLALTACNSTKEPPTSSLNRPLVTDPLYIDKTAKSLYLIGSFNLWTHREEHKLIEVGPQTYAASTRLTKGQNYEFMFAAKDSSQAYANCGHLNKPKPLLNQKVKASCNKVVLEHFSFDVKDSGVYEFFLEIHSLNHPMVYIKRAY